MSDKKDYVFDLTFNVLVIQANISQSEGDWQSAMQFCGSPLGSRNPLNTSSDITVNVSSSGDINRLSWIAAYAFYTPWIKMLVTTEFGGVEECLASMYTGIFTEDSTSYYGFRAPVVLPCSTPDLGTLRKKRRAILNASNTDTIDSDGVYTEIGNVYNAFPEGDTISTLSDRPLYTEPISLPERKKKRSSRRKEEKEKKRSLPRVPVGDSPNGTIGASRLSDLPVRRKSDFNVIESVIQMYDEAKPAVSQPKTSQNIPDVVPQHEYHILEKLKNSEKVKDDYEDVEKSNDNVYHVLEPNPSPGETVGNRHGSATMRVSNRIPLSKWVGGRAANYEPSRISRIIHSQEGNLQTVQEGFEVDLNKKRTAVSLRSKHRRATVITVVSASGVNNTALEIHDVKSCLEYCAGSTYFGLTNDRCICYGDSFTLSNIGRCLPQRCSGSGQDFCGGPGEAIVYQTVPDQFSGVGECLASGYRGEYNYTGAQFHLFNQAVVLPCDNKELGYIYRTVLGFPQSHHLFVYTLPVDSWQNAVLGSYQTAVGILEFVNFLLAKQSLATPIVGDKYWVGLFRRHQVKFGSELPLSGDVSCVAGKININGTMTTVLRSCTDQLRVLCEPNGVDVTVDATTSSTVTAQSGNNNATKTNHKITNLGIEDSEQFIGTTVWYIVLAVLSFLLLVVIIITIVWSLK
uniref:Uncharacterized protein n=1 Tax=Magallana gigas TaxID=29159 RepID=K1Q7Q1_MAGGI